MKKELELYVHIPFCVKKCAYCDFLSGPADHEQKRAYFDALIKEIRFCGDYTEYDVISIFFGGGTPSSVPGEWIAEIMEAIKNHFSIEKAAEITIEANPGTVDMQKLEIYKKAGINRISFGCQSADNTELKKLGRIHTWETFLESYQLARACGFDNINVDLMSGLPDQTEESWEETINKVVSLNPEHISAYSLIVEEGTPFYNMADELNLPEEEEERLMYERTALILKENGYEQYEFSNYAKNKKACRHNIGYWTGREYLGLGLGAASMMKQKRFHNCEDMNEYLRDCEKPELLRQDVQTLSKENQMEEFMILGLRMICGVSEDQFQSLFDNTVDEVYGRILDKYIAGGYLERKDGRISFSRKGISVSNIILSELLL